MHSVDIGICRYDHLVVAKPFYAVLDVQGSLKQVELIVAVDNLLFLSV